MVGFKYAPQGEVRPTEVPVENVVNNDKKEAETQIVPLQKTTTTTPKPLPPLTQVVGLDTLTYYSKQDSIALNKELIIYDKKYDEAEKAFNTKYDEAEKAFNAKYNEAEKAFNAKYDENQDLEEWAASRSKALDEWSKSRGEALNEWSNSRSEAISEWVSSREKSIQAHCIRVKKWQP